jgi:hypothetical protein
VRPAGFARLARVSVAAVAGGEETERRERSTVVRPTKRARATGREQARARVSETRERAKSSGAGPARSFFPFSILFSPFHLFFLDFYF